MTIIASGYAPQRNELYETPYWAVESLLRHLPSVAGLKIWEPAAGNHRIADMLLIHGAEVTTSDIETYQRTHDRILDFINTLQFITPVPFDAIITNPPYGKGNKQAVTFTRNALACCNGWVAMLLTAKFDWGSTRVDMFRDCPRWCKKIVLLDRLRWFDGPDATTGTEDHAWFIWCPVDHPCTLAHVPPAIVYEGNPYK